MQGKYKERGCILLTGWREDYGIGDQKAESFDDATYEELQDIYDLIPIAPGFWLNTLNDWVEGKQLYFPYDYASGAQYIIGTMKGHLNL
jgi:hypothetical protein